MGSACGNSKNQVYEGRTIPNAARSKRTDVDESTTIGESKSNEYEIEKAWKTAIYKNDLSSVSVLLEEHSNLLNHEFPSGGYAIHICAKQGYTRLIYELYKFGDDLTKKNVKNGNTALHYAVKKANLKLSFGLIDWTNGEIAEIENNNGELPYDIAVQIKNDELIELLTPEEEKETITDTPLSPLVYPEFYLNYLWEEFLTCETEDREFEMVFVLIHCHLDAFSNHEFPGGNFAIHVCAERGWIKSFDWLLSYGFDVTKKNCKTGNTALHYAVEKSNWKLANYLVNDTEYGHQLLEIRNNNGKLPYDLALQTNDELLIKLVTPEDERGEECEDKEVLIR